MNHDLALVAAVLESRDMAEAIRAGADAPGLLGEEARIYWDLLKDHYDAFHEVPSLDYFAGLCPTYQHRPPKDSIKAIVHELKTQKLGADIDQALCNVAELNAGDPWEAKKILIQLTDKVASRNSKGNNLYIMGQDKEATLSEIERLQNGNGLLGYPWPWDYFNSRSQGVCGGNAFYVYGRQKSRKTFLLLYMAIFYWSQGLKVLFFTREMSCEELKWRIVALACGFNYLDVLKGNISSEGKKLVGDMMTEMYEDGGRMVITDVADGVSGFKSMIEEVRPQIVFHDYFKAMADDIMPSKGVGNEHKYVARTIDMMKSYVSDKAKIPLIFAGHANREGAKSKGSSDTEHAWSDHITRRVDGAFRVVADNANDRIALFVNAGRSMRPGTGLTLDGSLCATFGEVLSEDYGWVKGYVESEDEENNTKVRNDPKVKGTGAKSKLSPKSFRRPFRRN